MKRVWATVLTGAALFLGGISRADTVSVSTSVPTAIIPTSMFGTKTIVLKYEGAGTLYLASQAIVSTASFVTDGFGITTATGAFSLAGFRGPLYGLAAGQSAAQTLKVLGGQ